MKQDKSLRRMLIVPLMLLVASVAAEISNCHHAQLAIREDLDDTIMILATQDNDMVAKQDTIRRLEQINYAMAQPLFLVADQKMPGVLFGLSVVSAISLAAYSRRRGAAVVMAPDACAAANAAMLPAIAGVRLTPMQRQLMDLLMSSPGYCVSKHDICTALWGNKMNAEESLYTLIRRTKQTLAATNVEIACNRGESYELRLS